MKKLLAILILAPLLGLGAWTAPDTYTVNLVYYETPESIIVTFTFKDG